MSGSQITAPMKMLFAEFVLRMVQDMVKAGGISATIPINMTLKDGTVIKLRVTTELADAVDAEDGEPT